MSPQENHMQNPTYRQVCNGDTGHVEVLQVELNNPTAHFEELIKFFFLFHDPTTKDRQGNDRGSQYASAVFVSDDEQKRLVDKVMRDLQSAIDSGKISPYSGKKIVTDVHRATKFYAAEDYHQEVRFVFRLTSPYISQEYLIVKRHVILCSIWRRIPMGIGK